MRKGCLSSGVGADVTDKVVNLVIESGNPALLLRGKFGTTDCENASVVFADEVIGQGSSERASTAGDQEDGAWLWRTLSGSGSERTQGFDLALAEEVTDLRVR